MNAAPAPEVTLGLPCYNERDNITDVLVASVAALERLGRTWEVIVVDNHSSDGTPAVVEEFVRHEPRVRLVVHEKNRFYSGSCQTILTQARGEYIAIMDSDGQFMASDLPQFLTELEGGANLVFGWRHHRQDPWTRKVMSKVFNAMARYYIGFRLHDLNVGLRMFDRRFADAAAVRHTLNMANPELFVRAKLAGLTCAEVPIQHAERTKGASCHNVRHLFRIFRTVTRYFRALSQELKAGRRAGALGPGAGANARRAA